MLRICFSLVLLVLGGAASADLRGPLRVIDGDTFAIGDMRIRLHGIDAPETAQMCGGQNGYVWPCGSWVTGEVRARFEGRPASCVALDVDRYDRIVARCEVDGVNLGETLVESGLAFAYRKYSEAYVPQEELAARRRAGLHATGVPSPAAFRAFQRQMRETRFMAAAPAGCVIKGNVSSRSGERIYHLPGQSWYAATKINPNKGERWFCSERDARDAGWRRAQR